MDSFVVFALDQLFRTMERLFNEAECCMTCVDAWLDARVEDKVIDDLKKAVGSKWKEIGRYLPEFSREEAEDVVSRYLHENPSNGDKFYYVVTAWVSKIGKLATNRKLVDALDNVGMGGVAQRILGF